MHFLKLKEMLMIFEKSDLIIPVLLKEKQPRQMQALEKLVAGTRHYRAPHSVSHTEEKMTAIV